MSFPNFGSGCCCAGSHRGRFHPGPCIPCECQQISKNIIFASGAVPVVLTTLANGAVGMSSVIGCGTALSSVISNDNTIYSTGPVKEAYVVQQTGTVSAMSASFTVTTAFNVVGQTTIVKAQVYRAPAGSDIFSPTDASVNLAPALTSLITVGTALTGQTPIVPPVAVAAGDRLLMVFTMSGSLGDLAASVTGTASARITIE